MIISKQEQYRLGRKPALTRFEGFQLLEARKLWGSDRVTIDQFIDEMLRAGELKRRVSRATMQRLLSGNMFPDLHTFLPDGTEDLDPYDYSKVPRCPPGQTPRPERLLPDGKLRPRLTKGQIELVDEIKRVTEAHVATQVEIMVMGMMRSATVAIKELREETAALLEKIASLEQKLP